MEIGTFNLFWSVAERNVVLVIHFDIFNHIIIIFKSSQHRHGIAPFRMRFFQITWYNFEYHLRCVCVAQALKIFCALILLFFLLQTPTSFWSFNDFNVFLVIQKKNYVLVSVLGECSKGYEQDFFYFGPIFLYFVCCPALKLFCAFFVTLTNAFLKL